jgi:hypothetical protein
LLAADVAVTSFQTLVVDAKNLPVRDANVVVAFKDGTVLADKTNQQGISRFENLKQTIADVYVARAGYFAVNLSNQDLSKVLRATLQIGGSTNSIVFIGQTGFIPGLNGRLDLRFDNNDHYLYADGIRVNDGSPQPVHFRLGEGLTLKDAQGAAFKVVVMAMSGHASLLEYSKVGP